MTPNFNRIEYLICEYEDAYECGEWDPDIYTQILDEYGLERPKCIHCGGDIVYPQTKVKLVDNKLIINKANYQLTKTINEHDYHLCVCGKCLQKKFPNIKNLSRTLNVMSEKTKYAFNISDEDFLIYRRRYAMTKEHMIQKYGEEDGLKKWEEYCNKQRDSNSFEYKQKKYGWTKEQYDEYNKSRSSTKANFIKRHGKEEGEQLWEKYCERQRETKTIEWMIENHGEEYALQVLEKRRKGLQSNSFCSIQSQEFFKKLDKYLSPKYTTYYATKNKEQLRDCGLCSYLLDYYIEELNICIEYNGTIWHGDPRVFEPDSQPLLFLNITTSAQDLWAKDEFRRKTLNEKFGIITHTVWEADATKKSFDFKDFIQNTLKIEL